MLNFSFKPLRWVVLLAVVSACSNSDKTAETAVASTPTSGSNTGTKQLNMTVLLDISNRINATYGQDNQENRDLAIVNSTATTFKDWMGKQGAYRAKGRYSVYFEPQPQTDPELDKVARSLQFDLAGTGMNPAAKKQVYTGIVAQTDAGVKQLYKAVRKQEYLGADLWGFAKDKMAKRCIQDPSKYRNVLVVVTDGYVDHVRNRGIREGNKLASINDSYIDKELIKKAGFNQANWSSKYANGGYGILVPAGTNLKGLEVLVLEVNTYSRPPFYNDLVKRYISDWFKGMGASRVEVRSTDMPTYTETEIKKFLEA